MVFDITLKSLNHLRHVMMSDPLSKSSPSKYLFYSIILTFSIQLVWRRDFYVISLSRKLLIVFYYYSSLIYRIVLGNVTDSFQKNLGYMPVTSPFVLHTFVYTSRANGQFQFNQLWGIVFISMWCFR